jgi:hypothetical protein
MTVLAVIAALAAATCLGYYLGRRAGATPPGGKQIGEHLFGKKLAAMSGQERNMLPDFRRCPATDSASKNSR